MEEYRAPFSSYIDVSIPPPPLPPHIEDSSTPVARRSLNTIRLPYPPPSLMSSTQKSPFVQSKISPDYVSNKPPPPVFLVSYNDRFVMIFKNRELIPQYKIEEDLWHRFGVLSCSVVIERDPQTGAPITDDEVQIHFRTLEVAQAAYNELRDKHIYCDLKFHKECLPPLEQIKAIEVSQSLDNFYCLTFKEEAQANINWDVSTINEIFSKYGRVVNVNKDQVGNIYVRYAEKLSAQLALFHLAHDPLIHLRNARNMKDRIVTANNKMSNAYNLEQTKEFDTPKKEKQNSSTEEEEDDMGSTGSADLSMFEIEAIENAIKSNSIILD